MTHLEPLAPQSWSLLGPIHRETSFPLDKSVLCQAWCRLPAAITKAGWCRAGLGSGTFQGQNYIRSLEGSPKHDIPSPHTGLGLAVGSGLGPVSQGCGGGDPQPWDQPHMGSTGNWVKVSVEAVFWFGVSS